MGKTTRKTYEEFVNLAKNIHGNEYDYSKVKYENNKTQVCIICPKHGEFFQRPDRHLRGQGCPKCRYEKSAKSNTLSNAKFIEKAKKVHGDRYDYSKVNYVKSKEKVCIICNEHGEFFQTPSMHLQGKGCPKCVGKNKTTEEFIKSAKKIHGDKYDYSKVEYVNFNTKVCIICPVHGEFWQTPHGHMNGDGCLMCNNNKLENEIDLFLRENNLSYERQKKFLWLKSKNNLSLDFYLPDYNVAIECQGKQHFEPVEYFGGEGKFIEQKNKDLIKIKECYNHEIKLLYFSHDKRKHLNGIEIIKNKEKLLKTIKNGY